MTTITIFYRDGELVLRQPTPAEVLELEEERRLLDAPLSATGGMSPSTDGGAEVLAGCVSNMSKEGARAVLRRFPGLIPSELFPAFRAVGHDFRTFWASEQWLRDDSAITHEHKKNYGGNAVGLRLFGVPVVLRPIEPERYRLMEKRKASAPVRYGVPPAELAELGRTHVVAPQGAELEQLLAAHPYLALNLGAIVLDEAAGAEDRLVGKLASFSKTSTPPPSEHSSTKPDFSLPPDSETASPPTAAPQP